MPVTPSTPRRRTVGTLAARAVVLTVLAGLVACARALVPAPTSGPVPTVAAGPSAPPSVPVRPPVRPPSSAIAPDVVAESLLVDVAALDSAIHVDLRYATPFNFTGAVLPGYEAPHALLRREAARALVRVQQRVAGDGLALKVFDAYRPARATEAMVAWTRRVNREDLLKDGYIAERSRHNLGLAVDLTLVEQASGRELRMGTGFDTFGPSAHTANATGEYAANRQRLKRAMEAEGFTSLAEEWWHFGYEVPDPLRFDLVIR